MTGDVTLGYMLSRFGGLLNVNTLLPKTNTTVGAATLTAAQIAGGFITRSGSTAAYTDTTDTATAIIAALPNNAAGNSFDLYIKNTTAFAETISAGTGVTVSGSSVVQPNSTGKFIITIVAGGTVTMVGTSSGSLPATQFNTGTTTTTFTAGQLTGANDVVYNNSGATPGSIATRTAALMIADIPNAAVGQTWRLRVINGQGTGTLTITAGTGVTLTGTMTVAANTWRDFVCTYTAAGAITIQNAGVGTFS